MNRKARAATHVPMVADRAARVRLLDIVSPSFGFAGGLATIVEHIAVGLESVGIGTRLPCVMRMDGSPTIGASILARSQSDEGHAAVGDAVAFFGPPTSWHAQRRRRVFGFSGLESDVLHPMWTAATVAADELWAPSTFAKTVFEESGARRPVVVIPPGIDPQQFSYRRRQRGAKLRILMFSTAIDDPRKGADVGIAAFKAAFQHRDDVELVLRSSHPPTHPLVPTNDARISRRGGILTPEQLAAEYNEYDALLCTSRFESFGLVPLEAMATGLPAILPRAGALEEIADLGMGASTRRIRTMARGELVALNGGWFEASHDDLVEYLRLIDAEYETVMDYAAKSAVTIAERYTWENTVGAIADLLSA